MIKSLMELEASLSSLLLRPEFWNTLDVDYEPPHVERLWMQLDGGRLYLHRIHPCDTALYHPHPWPSAVHLIHGSYEMAVGAGRATPPVATNIRVAEGTYYEMLHPEGWHSVKPSQIVLSTMITGKPFDAAVAVPAASPPKHKLKPLSEKTKLEVLAQFGLFRAAFGVTFGA